MLPRGELDSMGVTTGAARTPPTYEPTRSIKQVLGYPLVKNFRQRLSHVQAAA